MAMFNERAQVPNTIHEGEYWLRCPHCEDSDNEHKAHYSVRLRDGVYFCLRCTASGRLNKGQLYNLIGNLPVSTHSDYMMASDEKNRRKTLDAMKIISQLQSGPAIRRESKLERFHYIDDNDKKWDAFRSYDILLPDEPTGVLLRLSGKDKASYFYGIRSYAWERDFHRNITSHTEPLRLVEGPYDVMSSQDVCTFGIPSISMMSDFYGQNIILCPDGDVWQKSSLKKGFIKLLRFLLYSPTKRKPYLTGIEHLPNGKDPDEVELDERVLISREHLYNLISNQYKGNKNYEYR